MKPYEGDGFSAEHRWKEEVYYWEGRRGFCFQGGWGVTPAALYVPSARIWDQVTPDWLRGRREEVIARLKLTGDDIYEDDHPERFRSYGAVER